jgi:hypothetical protein
MDRVEEIVDIQERYQDITLNFGKYKGKTLKEIIKDEKGPRYLTWLHGEMKQNDKPSPTQKAILKYIAAVYDL